jgi:D-sedoheptulose 7-phosphate isomerase
MATDHEDLIRQRLSDSIAVKEELKGDEYVAVAREAADKITSALQAGNKVLFCGNGGSAADSMHLAAELVGRFKLERSPLPAISLSDNVSSVTAIGNDYDYQQTFSRQVRALGRDGDVLVALSTSGGSPNVLAAVEAAHELGITTIGCTGSAGGELGSSANLALRVPSRETARIQEGYMNVLHTVCELVEMRLFPDA